jgi:hypothetical protein
VSHEAARVSHEAARNGKRDANLAIAKKAREVDFGARVPFLCECSDATCRGFARLPVDAFDVIATQAAWYLIGDAHDVRAAVIEFESDRTVVEMAALAV